MQDNDFLFPENIYSNHLASINGIKFTRREIDVIACLLSARGTSKIASLLSIALRTVVSHIRNIMLKLECGSREGIIDFIERSQKLPLLREYYASLITEVAFEKSLKEISKLKRGAPPKYLVIYWENQDLRDAFLQHLDHHLHQAGIKVEVRDYNSDQKVEVRENLDRSLLLLVPKQSEKEIAPELMVFSSIDLSEHKNYYLALFEIFKSFVPNTSLSNIILNFQEHSAGVKYVSRNEKIKRDGKEINRSNGIFFKVAPFLKEKWHLMISLSVLGLVSAGTLMFKLNQNLPQTYLINHEINPKALIRSDLIIPAESSLLHRPELITEIDTKFKNQKGIQTVALVGPGGAGKTILARQYAHGRNFSVIWEVNAETQENLSSSFENLANALAKTTEDKKTLRGIQEIKSSKEREEKIIQFVKEYLRSHPHWFLIFDNLEKFSDIQKYFPQDCATWGEGKIILTTRDSNIQNNKYINEVVQIGELNEAQKIDLFTKITIHGSKQAFTPTQIKEAKTILEKIPPFPLDISIAAYYLKATNISYKTYLESLTSYDNKFEELQTKILKEAENYNKTRFGIISLSLQNIISINKDFKDLLLLISLIDSQNIPRDLLNKYKDKTVVDSFIYNLKKQSLITNETIFSSVSTLNFSIHRSSQELALLYLTKLLNLEQDHELLKDISDKLEMYLSYIRDTEDQQRMKNLINHCEQFLNHRKSLGSSSSVSIESTLGSIYFYLCAYERAKELLEQSIIKLKKHSYKPYNKYFDSLVWLGSVYLELGNFEIAKKLLNESIRFNERFPQNDDRIALALVYLGNVYRELGDYKKAKNLFEQGLAFYKKLIPKNEIKIAWALTYLGNINKELGNFETAKNLLEESHKTYQKIYGNNHIETAWVVGFLGIVHRELGDCKESIRLLEKSFDVYKKHFPETYVINARIFRNIGKSHLSCGNFETAEKMLNKSLEIMKDKKYPKVYMCLEDLSELFLKRAKIEMNKNNKEAQNLFKNKSTEYLLQALNAAKTYYLKNSPHILRIELKLKNQNSGIVGK